jgi:GT2 family glycosyltransferase
MGGGWFRVVGAGAVSFDFELGAREAELLARVESPGCFAEGMASLIAIEPRDRRLPPANTQILAIGADVVRGASVLRLSFTRIAARFRLDVRPVRFSGVAPLATWLADRRAGPSVMGARVVENWGDTAFERRARRAKPRAITIDEHVAHVFELAARASTAPALASGPVELSIVTPVFNTPVAFLDDLLASLRGQRGCAWELVLSDDGSTDPATLAWLAAHAGDPDIVVVTGHGNRGIAAATNAGLARASGVWLGLVDHDDVLAPFALERVMRALRANPRCRYLYTDELIVDDKLKPMSYFLKPAWDPVLLSGVNYVNHFSVYDRARLLAIGGLRDGFQGSQDYDLALRYTAALGRDEILHLPYPAYVWRRSRKTYSTQNLGSSSDSARRALREHFMPRFPRVEVVRAGVSDLHRVDFDPARADWPLVSVVMPSRDGFELVSRALEGLTRGTDYPNLEIIIIDNGSTDPRVLALYEAYRRGSIPFEADIRSEPFNFSRATNRGVGRARGDLVLWANNDLEILEPGWLKEMVSCFNYPGTGVVGAKLLYPNRTIQHAGVIVGFGDLAGHWFVGEKENYPGPMARLWVRGSLTAVTGACLLTSRACIDAVGPLNETELPVAYNDIDYCIRAREQGFAVIWTPFATLIHHESATRGSDEKPANVERFKREQAAFKRLRGTAGFEDPFLNPWYSKIYSLPAPIRLGALPEARTSTPAGAPDRN